MPPPRRPVRVAGRVRSLRVPGHSGFRRKLNNSLTQVYKWTVWKTLLPLGTLVTVIATIIFSANTLAASNEQGEITRQTAISDRYSTAIEQLGSEVETIRTGGIYSLESIAVESADRAAAVFNVLFSFIRSHSSKPAFVDDLKPQTCPAPGISSPEVQKVYQERFGTLGLYDPPPDLQTAVDVVSRSANRLVPKDEIEFDLTGSCLASLDFSDANLRGADLTEAILSNANFTGADLTGASVNGSMFITGSSTVNGVNIASGGPKFDQATLDEIDFTGDFKYGNRLGQGDLNWKVDGATFFGSKFDRFNLGYSDDDFRKSNGSLPHPKVFAGADLRGASLRDVSLAGADLSEVKNLADADLTGAYYTPSTEWPAGFTPPESADCYLFNSFNCVVYTE